MGVYFRGGAVFGYKVHLDDIPDNDVDPHISEQAYFIAKKYGVQECVEGDKMSDTSEPEVVFYDEGNYFAGSQTFNEQYGFFKVGGTEPSEELQQLARDINGEWGTYGFFTVW